MPALPAAGPAHAHPIYALVEPAFLLQFDSGTPAMINSTRVITGLQRKYTKKGELMAVFTLEDLDAAIECMVFPKTMQECGHVLKDDALVTVRAGRVGRGRAHQRAARDAVLLRVVVGHEAGAVDAV